MIIKERKEIVGKLLTQGHVFELLEINPRAGRDLSFLLRESSFEFYVVVNGYAQYIVVSRGSFAIIPYSVPEVQDVGFIVEGEEEQLDEVSILEHRLERAVEDYKDVFRVRFPV